MHDLDDLGQSPQYRCDRCGAQAYTAVIVTELLLLFCMHHTNKHRSALEAAGYPIDDRTHILYEPNSVPADA